ncbi:MAG: tyrosine-protein phosphatase [Ramlibacter sp.]|nr:tyrosine-protein phosphatase [Ramlibacter sp.]
MRNPSNFRDLGGHRAAGGRLLRTGRLYRSDHLGALTPDEAAAVSALGIDRVLDLRGATERCAAPCVLTGVTVHSLAIEPTIVQVLTELIAAGQALTTADVVAHMQDTYRGFVRHNTPRFAELFRHLLEADAPLVFHCTAGKDRTGFAAALILHALGVGADDVMRDYLLTNERLRPPEGDRHGLAPEVARVLWRVQPEFLNAAFDAVQQDHGGLENYLQDALGLGLRERERLARQYLG